jgi:hypothetical protein
MSKKKPDSASEAAPDAEEAQATPPADPTPDVVEAAPVIVPAQSAKQYKVERLAKYCHGGMVHTLAAGSIVSEMTHDLADVRAQGVPLVEVP